MVDVGEKIGSMRSATASATVFLGKQAYYALTRMNGTMRTAKGDVFSIAQTAGIMAAKRTPDLIPLCHTVPLSSVTVSLALDESAHSVNIEAMARTGNEAKTGVEMEALTAASVAALTVYDMCKAVNKGIEIRDIRLLRKSGGKSGDYEAM